MTRIELLNALLNVKGLPDTRSKFKGREVYEAADGSFHIDYAAYPWGSAKAVPFALIKELEAEGVLVLAYPQKPTIRVWRLAGADAPQG